MCEWSKAKESLQQRNLENAMEEAIGPREVCVFIYIYIFFFLCNREKNVVILILLEGSVHVLNKEGRNATQDV